MKLAYNDETKRFGVINSMDLWENEGLHCGQCLKVLINGEWVEDRLEMTWDSQWYLVKSKLKGEQLENLKVEL